MNLPDFSMEALLVAAGAAGAKVLDFFLARKKTESDTAVNTYNAVNAAQKQLVDGLFQQMKVLQESYEELRQQLATAEEQRVKDVRRIAELEHEVATLRAMQRGSNSE